MQPLEHQFERLKTASGVNSDTAFAEFLGISQGSISGAKKKQQIPHSWFFQVADRTNVSSDWLFFGRGPMRPGDAARPTKPAQLQPETTMETVGCGQCVEMKAELEKEREERRELAQENRSLNAENRQLTRENGDLRVDNGVLREQIKKLSGRYVAVDCA